MFLKPSVKSAEVIDTVAINSATKNTAAGCSNARARSPKDRHDLTIARNPSRRSGGCGAPGTSERTGAHGDAGHEHIETSGRRGTETCTCRTRTTHRMKHRTHAWRALQTLAASAAIRGGGDATLYESRQRSGPQCTSTVFARPDAVSPISRPARRGLAAFARTRRLATVALPPRRAARARGLLDQAPRSDTRARANTRSSPHRP